MKTHREQYNKRHGFPLDTSHSISEYSKISKVSVSILREVYNRGTGAYKSNPTSVRMKGSYKKNVKAPMSNKLSKEQWSYARVVAFLNKIEGKQKLNHDTDLYEKIKNKK